MKQITVEAGDFFAMKLWERREKQEEGTLTYSFIHLGGLSWRTRAGVSKVPKFGVFIFIKFHWSTVTFICLRQRRLVVTESIWPMKPKILSGPFRASSSTSGLEAQTYPGQVRVSDPGYGGEG